MVATTKALRALDRREVHPLLQIFRDYLRGRPNISNLRWREDLAPRSTPLPNLPDGPAHKLSTNYYHTRDNRRQYYPAIDVYDAQQKLLKSGSESAKASTTKAPFGCTPGEIYNPDAKCW